MPKKEKDNNKKKQVTSQGETAHNDNIHSNTSSLERLLQSLNNIAQDLLAKSEEKAKATNGSTGLAIGDANAYNATIPTRGNNDREKKLAAGDSAAFGIDGEDARKEDANIPFGKLIIVAPGSEKNLNNTAKRISDIQKKSKDIQENKPEKKFQITYQEEFDIF